MSNITKSRMAKLRNDWEKLDKAVELIDKIDPYLYLTNGQAEYLEQTLGDIGWHIKRELGIIERELLDGMKNKVEV